MIVQRTPWGHSMPLDIVLIVLVSSVLHPAWNLILKKNPDPQLGFLALMSMLVVCAFVHGLIEGVDFAAVFTVLPFIALSAGGLLLYGLCLTETLKRGDLSTYYPIIRSSPVFIVAFSVLFLGKSYPLVVLAGIALAVAGGFLLQFRRGTHFFENPGALGFALLAMAGTGIYSLADARLMQTITPQAQITVVDGLLVPIYGYIWWRRRRSEPEPLAGIRSLSPVLFVLPGVMAYASYYLILIAYKAGADVAAVTTLRQASIPISVALGGLFLREGTMLRRFLAAGLLALGLVVIALNG